MSSNSEHSNPSQSGHRFRRVVVVEDNPDDERLTRSVLKNLQYTLELQVARDGSEAIELLNAADPKPDLVLLDIRLPMFSGYEVLRSVRAKPENRYYPIVMFTSSDDPKEMAECYDSGANSFITKPIDTTRYTQLLGLAAEYWLGANSVPNS